MEEKAPPSAAATSSSTASGGMGLLRSTRLPTKQYCPLRVTQPSKGKSSWTERSMAWCLPVAKNSLIPLARRAWRASRVEAGMVWVRKLTSVPSTSKKMAWIMGPPE